MMKELFAIPITLFTVLIALCQDNVSQSLIPPIQYSVTTEINYAGNKNMAQTLDVYIPKNKKKKNYQSLLIFTEKIFCGGMEIKCGRRHTFSIILT